MKEFQDRVILWYKREGRTFYWRKCDLNIWQWLVLELLLKRTKAETVEKVFISLICKYSSPRIVVEVTDKELESDLRYLGLYRQRRIALKKIAEWIMWEHNGQTPSDEASLMKIPHVGLYISNAVLCFCKGQRKPIVDTNIARILTRLHGLDIPKDAREKWLWQLAEKSLPREDWKEYNYGLLDLGASVCSKKPKCILCCLSDICMYAKSVGR